jgi:hypothetical protein
MPHQTCIVCRHPELAAIENALKAGASVRVVAKQFGVSHSVVHTHRHHDKGVKSRKDVNSFERIDAEIRKLRHAETAAKKRKDGALALSISKELRSWFTLRVKAEAIAGAVGESQQPQQISRAEAVATAKAIIEAEATSGVSDVVVWLRELLERIHQGNKSEQDQVPVVEPTEPE